MQRPDRGAPRRAADRVAAANPFERGRGPAVRESRAGGSRRQVGWAPGSAPFRPVAGARRQARPDRPEDRRQPEARVPASRGDAPARRDPPLAGTAGRWRRDTGEDRRRNVKRFPGMALGWSGALESHLLLAYDLRMPGLAGHAQW